MSRMRGSDISARAMASICCSPPDMEPASWRRRSANTGKASNANARLSSIRFRADSR